MEVVVGSASAIKLEALRQVYPNATVSGVDVVSAVPPQPIGRAQTEEGTTSLLVSAGCLALACAPSYKAVEAHKAKPGADMWVGIENGMYLVGEEQKWVDAACIVIMEKHEGGTRESVVWSDEIDIPADFPKGPNGEWSVLKDPHKEISQGKRPRTAFLSDALLTWKNRSAAI